MIINCISYRLKKSPLAAIFLAAALIFPSCDRLHEDLQPCETGICLRFVENENMEESNVFYKQVHCLNLFIYDAQGNFLQSHTAQPEEIQDENWRMELSLAPGQYKFLAYGGMDCEDASFSFVSNPTSTRLQDVQVCLDPQFASESVDRPLHYLFYGALDIDIPQAGIDTGYTEATMEMMKDTNDLRIILANENGLPTNSADFDFNILCDNSEMNYLNEIVPTSVTTYWPWTQGNANLGLTEDDNPDTVAWAELSIPRLVVGNNPTTLLITNKDDGSEVVRIPLLNILLLYKSERPQYSYWTPQQFLDRESRWNLTFFLTNDGLWIETKIVVNDWIVRINNIDDL